MLRIALLVLLCSGFAALPGQSLRLDDWPRDRQLYPRDRLTNQGTVVVRGTVLEPGWDSIRVLQLREGTPSLSVSLALSYSGDSAAFELLLPQPAERANYRYELTLVGPVPKLVRTADDVVAGDAILVHGQSNAYAFGAGSVDYEDPFIRAFGRHGGLIGAADTVWNVATGDGLLFVNQPGAIGQWALVMARKLTGRSGVPIAVINHAVGGKPINFFLKGDTTDLALNYSLLLMRLKEAGLRRDISAVVWYQGESDAYSQTNALDYKGRFLQLYHDLGDDLRRAPRRMLVCQTRPGCGGAATYHNIIAEYMRQAADHLPGISVVSTNGLDGHDGCHYVFEDGYEDLGFRIAAELGHRLYGWALPVGGVAPNVTTASYTSAVQDEIAIGLRDPAELLTIEPGAAGDFAVIGGPVVTGVTQVGGQLILQLAGASTATQVRYLNHTGSGPDVLGTLGQGLLSFTIDVAAAGSAKQAAVPARPQHTAPD